MTQKKSAALLSCAALLICVSLAAKPQPTASEKVTCGIEVFAVELGLPSGNEITITAKVSSSTSCAAGSAMASIAAEVRRGTLVFSYSGSGQVVVSPGNTKTTSFTATRGDGQTGTVRFRVGRASCGGENPGCEPPGSSAVSASVDF